MTTIVNIVFLVLGVSVVAYIFSMKRLMKKIGNELDSIVIERGFVNQAGTDLLKKPTREEKIDMIQEAVKRSDNIKNKGLVLNMVKLYNVALVLVGVIIALGLFMLFKGLRG